MAIVRGTTPTIIFTFKTIDVSDIDTAYLVIKQWDTAKITKDITSATVDSVAKTVSWTLTQTESLSLDPQKKAEVMMDWLMDDGIRGRSVAHSETIENPGKNEVIS